MRHRRKNKHFGRKSTALKALWRGLIINMVEHGRIKTTVDKAKELRGHVEKAITLGKKNDLASRRLLLSRIPHQAAVDAIMTNIAPRFMDRAGGYTRIIKIGRRPGDTVEMAFIEFVDYDYTKAGNTEAAPAKAVKGEKAEGKVAKKAKAVKVPKTAVVAKKKASAKKLQKKARTAARG